MKKILLITFLYPMFLLNAMEQKSDKYGSFFKIFYDFKKIGEHQNPRYRPFANPFYEGFIKAWQFKQSPKGPITKAINSGLYENIYDLVEDVTKDIELSKEDKLLKFVQMLHDEGLMVRSLIKKFFEEKYVQALSQTMGTSLSEAHKKFLELNKLEEDWSLAASHQRPGIYFSRFIPHTTQELIKKIFQEDPYFNKMRIEVVQTTDTTYTAKVTRLKTIILIQLGLDFYMYPQKAKIGILLHELAHAKKIHTEKRSVLEKQFPKEIKNIRKLQEYEADISAIKNIEYAECIEATMCTLKTIDNVFSLFDITLLFLLPIIIREAYLDPYRISSLLYILATGYGLYGLAEKYLINPDYHPANSKRYMNAKIIRQLLEAEAQILGRTLD